MGSALCLALGVLLHPALLFAQSGRLAAFPLPLHWGMTPAEIEQVVQDAGLHLAKSDHKLFVPPRYHEGRNYEWAVIMEETVKFLGAPRFIVFKMNQKDRLVGVSMKLINKAPSAHPAEYQWLVKQITETLGQPYQTTNIDHPSWGSHRTAWQVPVNSILEIELVRIQDGDKTQLISFVNLYWDEH
jgi:hypothetical protein